MKIDFRAIGVSFVCRARGERTEFAYFYLEGAEFMLIESKSVRQAQFKIQYAQMDNNIGFKQIYPILLYPKEILKRRDQKKLEKEEKIKKAAEKKKKEGKAKEVIKEFFNLYINMRKDIPNVLFFEKIDFLLQTIVLKMDDEVIGFIFKFTSQLTELLNTSITGRHPIFKQVEHDIADVDAEMVEVDDEQEFEARFDELMGDPEKEFRQTKQSSEYEIVHRRSAIQPTAFSLYEAPKYQNLSIK